MGLKMIQQFNWVDVLAIVVFCRICYIGIKAGFSAEIFKLLGVVFSVYVSYHYYTALSDSISDYIKPGEQLLAFFDFVVFLLVVAAAYSIFILFREAFSRFIKMEAVPQLNKWGGFILGLFRAVLVTGLVMYGLTISTINYLKNSTNSSYMGKYFLNASISTYAWIFDNVTSKFFTQEKFNKTILEPQEDTHDPEPQQSPWQ